MKTIPLERHKNMPDLSQDNLDKACEGIRMLAAATDVSEEEMLDHFEKFLKRHEYLYILGEIKDQYA